MTLSDNPSNINASIKREKGLCKGQLDLVEKSMDCRASRRSIAATAIAVAKTSNPNNQALMRALGLNTLCRNRLPSVSLNSLYTHLALLQE